MTVPAGTTIGGGAGAGVLCAVPPAPVFDVPVFDGEDPPHPASAASAAANANRAITPGLKYPCIVFLLRVISGPCQYVRTPTPARRLSQQCLDGSALAGRFLVR